MLVTRLQDKYADPANFYKMFVFLVDEMSDIIK